MSQPLAVESPVLPFTIERTGPTVLTVRLDASEPDWEQWFLIRSDAHHDNAHALHDLERKHLEQAVARNAGILDLGDLCCAMQGRWDKRADPRQFREELRHNYLDSLVSYNAEFILPYASHFVMLAPGNHETAVQQRHETDLTERIAERLRTAGSQVQRMPYAGWVRFMVSRSTQRESVRFRYTHGYGGGGPVTRDIIQTARQAVYLDADIVASGHTHDQLIVPIMRERLNSAGTPELDEMTFIKCGGYKDEYSSGEGWAVGKGLPPKPPGACWLRLYREPRRTSSGSTQTSGTRVRWEAITAK